MNKKSNKKQDVDQDLLLAPPTFWERVLGWFKFSPVQIAGDLLDLYANWILSRKWRYAFTMIPVLLLVFGFGTIVCIGKLVDDKSKVRWYIEEAEKQAKIASEETASKAKADAGVAEKTKPDTSDSISNSENKPDTLVDSKASGSGDKRTNAERAEYVDLLFRRVLQLEKSNKQALYYVALQMSRFGKTSAARQIMESLAPVRFGGFRGFWKQYSNSRGWIWQYWRFWHFLLADFDLSRFAQGSLIPARPRPSVRRVATFLVYTSPRRRE